MVDGCSVWVDVGVAKGTGVDVGEGGWVSEEVIVVGFTGEGDEEEKRYSCGERYKGLTGSHGREMLLCSSTWYA